MRNLFVTLALPPTGLVILAILGMLACGGLRRIGRIVTVFSLILLVLLGMPGVSGSLLLGLETGLPTGVSAEHPPQAIIILGGDVIRARDEKLGIRPGLLTLDRLRTGAALHRRTGLPMLVTGGTTQQDTRAVGLVMAQSLAEDFQVPARWTEARSVDTWENARFSADILRAEGISSVFLVTNAWHMRRAILAFQGTGLTVTAAPTPLDNPVGPDISDFLPRASGWQAAYYAAHEWIGYGWYQTR